MSGNWEVQHVSKMFAHCKVEWSVINFCLTIQDEDSLIYSPNFLLRGDCLSRWKMALKIGSVTCKITPISFILERMQDCGPNKVFANWEVIVIAGSHRFEAIEASYDFEKRSKRNVTLTNLERILENLEPFECDTLKIVCNMIIRGGDGPMNLNQETSVGLKYLSSDIKNMLKRTKYQDLTIEVDGKSIKAHKCMLSRFNLLKCMIEENPNENVLILEDFGYEDAVNFIEFLYSGNMDPILSKPSLSMYKFLLNISCDSLLRFYAPEQLFLRTNITAEEYCFHWIVAQFNSWSEDIASPLYKGINSNIIWQIRLNPVSSSMDSDYITIFAEVVQGIEPPSCCLEFAIVDAWKQYHFPKRIIKTGLNTSNMGFKYFVQRDQLESSSLLSGDSIHLVFRTRTTVLTPTFELGARVISSVTLPERTSYEELSSQMRAVFEGINECDMIIQAGNQKFPVHRAVLSARSFKLRRFLNSLPTTSDLMVLKDIQPSSAYKFLLFVYCGILIDCELDDLLQMHALAVCYGVKGMREECVAVLKSKVTDENRFLVLDLVKKFSDKRVASI